MGFAPFPGIADEAYLIARATAEANAAEVADRRVAAEIHHTLASCYLDKLFGNPPEAPAEKCDEEERDRVDAFRLAFQMLRTGFDDGDFDDLLLRLPE